MPEPVQNTFAESWNSILFATRWADTPIQTTGTRGWLHSRFYRPSCGLRLSSNSAESASFVAGRDFQFRRPNKRCGLKKKPHFFVVAAYSFVLNCWKIPIALKWPEKANKKRTVAVSLARDCVPRLLRRGFECKPSR